MCRTDCDFVAEACLGWDSGGAGWLAGWGCSLKLSGGVDCSRFGVMRLIRVSGSDKRNWAKWSEDVRV